MSGLDHLLSDLTDEQREAVTSEAAPLLVLAGAGSGKTRVLTRRIAWQASAERIDPRRVLAVTFTRKASSELARRLKDLGIHDQVTAGTFHALALAQLRRHWLDQGRRPPQVLDRKGKIVGRLIPRGAGSTAMIGPVVREIEWAQARSLTPEQYESSAHHARRSPPLPTGEMAALLGAYQEHKRKRGVVDFDDLLALCAEQIEQDPELAAVVHWRFRHLFVDEFQDLSPAQFRLLQAWLGGRKDMFAVGDDDQAIYGFGGGDARYLTDFRTYFGRDATMLRLTSNFRSTPQILAVANAVIAPSPTDKRRLLPTSEDGPAPIITSYESDADEAAGVARMIGDLQREGVADREFAVLARTNAQCAVLAAGLEAARIPVRIRGAARFVDRAEVERALTLLGELAAGRSAPLPAMLAEAVARAPRLAPDSDAALSLLVELGEEYSTSEADAGTAEGFREFIATHVRDEDPTPPINAVEVLTFHRAKGLEWPIVFVTGLEAGFVPISHATTEEGRQEERRLLHVALTRAQRRLFLSWSRGRSFGGTRLVARAPSPFIAGIAHHLPQTIAEAAGTTTDAGVGALRQAAAALRERRPDSPLSARPPDELLSALTTWRDHKAQVAGVPTGAIVDDATLRVIVAARPSDESHLAEVPGLGPSRLARYGPEILALVEDYARS